MQKIAYILLIAVFSLTACQQSFKKGDKGLEYKIINNGSGPKVKIGDFMQMHICQIANNGKKDSVLNDTRTTSGAVIEPFDANSIPPEYFKIISQLRKGDSLVMRILADSIFSQNPGQMPSYFKKGCYFTTTVKLLNIFHNVKEADSARMAERKLIEVRDSIENIGIMTEQNKVLQDYFKKNNINAVKSTQGVYVQITQPGTGANIDTTVIVKTNYTGRTLDGKMFDSNTDPSKGHVEPFNVNMTNDMTYGRGVIKGWTDGLKLLNKGAKAKMFIPSPLAYGKQGAGADIEPNTILVFDIEIVDVLTKDQAKAEMDIKLREIKLKQKRYMDSISKMKPDTTKSR